MKWGASIGPAAAQPPLEVRAALNSFLAARAAGNYKGCAAPEEPVSGSLFRVVRPNDVLMAAEKRTAKCTSLPRAPESTFSALSQRTDLHFLSI